VRTIVERQRLGRIVVTQELATPAMRDDDERELPARGFDYSRFRF
jgi:hypothetical protein